MRDPQKVIENLTKARSLLIQLITDSTGDERLQYKVTLLAVEEALREAGGDLKEEVACV